MIFRFKILHFGLSFLILIFAFSIIASHEANAGTIIRAPSYLGLNSGLVGYWTFDGSDISGTRAKDRSGNNNHGTIMGATRVAGKVGQGLRFDGTDDTVGVPLNLSGTATVTASFWLYSESYAADDTAISFGNGGWFDGAGFAVVPSAAAAACSTGELEVDNRGNQGPNQNCYAQASLNNWHHYVAVFDRTQNAANEVKFYLNGTLQTGLIPINTNNNDNPFPNSTLYLMSSGGSESFNAGIMDDVRIYNRALSASDVARIYKIGLGSKFNNASGGDSLDKGLVGHWTFDGSDISGTRAKDRSGNNNHGTITGATPEIGKVGQGLQFDGADDNVSTPLLLDGNPKTLSLWAKVDTFNEQDIFAGNYAVTTQRFHIGTATADGGNRIAVGGGAVRASVVPLSLETGVFHHFALVQTSATNLDVYQNGVFVGSVAFTGSTATENSFRIGTGGGSANEPSDDVIDDVRIYNRALTADEVKRLYNQTQSKFNSSVSASSIDRGLVGHWTFDGPDISGTRAKDRSGNNNHGTITGATKVIGQLGQALEFDEDDGDYVSVESDATIDSLPAMSISIWAKPYTLGGTIRGILAAKDLSFSGRGWRLENDSGNLSFFVPHGTQELYVNSQNGIILGKWTHYIVTWNGSANASGVHIYENGVEVAYASFQNGEGARGSDDATLVIGNTTEITGREYDGILDDVRIYNRALSADEVRKLYNMGR